MFIRPIFLHLLVFFFLRVIFSLCVIFSLFLYHIHFPLFCRYTVSTLVSFSHPILISHSSYLAIFLLRNFLHIIPPIFMSLALSYIIPLLHPLPLLFSCFLLHISSFYRLVSPSAFFISVFFVMFTSFRTSSLQPSSVSVSSSDQSCYSLFNLPLISPLPSR